jgi:hypothetical protein
MAVDRIDQWVEALTAQHTAALRVRRWYILGLFAASLLATAIAIGIVVAMVIIPSWLAAGLIALVLSGVVAAGLFFEARRLERRGMQAALDDMAEILPRLLESERTRAVEKFATDWIPANQKEPLAALIALQLAGVTPQTAAAGLLLSASSPYLTEHKRALAALAALGVNLDGQLGSLLGQSPTVATPPAGPAPNQPGQAGQTGPSPVPQVTVSTQQPIPKLTLIQAGDVAITSEALHPDSFQALDQVVGRYTLAELQPGAVIQASQISPARVVGGTLAPRVQIAVPVARDSLWSSVAAHQQVSLIIVPRPGDPAAHSILLNDVTIVAVEGGADPAILVIEVEAERALEISPLLGASRGYIFKRP